MNLLNYVTEEQIYGGSVLFRLIDLGANAFPEPLKAQLKNRYLRQHASIR